MKHATQVNDADVTKLAAIIERLPEVDTPSGYDRIDLAVLDAIQSIGVRYGTVENVLRRYSDYAEKVSATGSVADLIGIIERCGGPDGFAKEIGNHNRTSSKNGILKSDAVLRVARILEGAGINDQTTLVGRYEADDVDEVKAAWLGVPGQRSGISWRYFLILNRIEDVKPDRMIQRFTERALGSGLSTHDVGALVTAAAALVGQTPRHVDHRIWRYERDPDRDLSVFPDPAER